MKTIEVTMEKVQRVSHQFEVTDDVYSNLYVTGRIPDDMFHYMQEVLDDTAGDTEYDYSVVDVNNPYVNMVDWD